MSMLNDVFGNTFYIDHFKSRDIASQYVHPTFVMRYISPKPGKGRLL